MRDVPAVVVVESDPVLPGVVVVVEKMFLCFQRLRLKKMKKRKLIHPVDFHSLSFVS